MTSAQIEREPIEVVVAFLRNGMRPLRFRKAGRVYPIQMIHLIHREHRGREQWLYFSVSDGTNTYRLAHATDSAAWYLETVPEL